MRPRDTKTIDQICRLRRDNFDADDFWIMLSGTDEVTICAQALGHAATEQISIPRKTFNKLIDWYMREQKTSKAA